jgi:hypothetical protein
MENPIKLNNIIFWYVDVLAGQDQVTQQLVSTNFAPVVIIWKSKGLEKIGKLSRKFLATKFSIPLNTKE